MNINANIDKTIKEIRDYNKKQLEDAFKKTYNTEEQYNLHKEYIEKVISNSDKSLKGILLLIVCRLFGVEIRDDYTQDAPIDDDKVSVFFEVHEMVDLSKSYIEAIGAEESYELFKTPEKAIETVKDCLVYGIALSMDLTEIDDYAIDSIRNTLLSFKCKRLGYWDDYHSIETLPDVEKDLEKAVYKTKEDARMNEYEEV